MKLSLSPSLTQVYKAMLWLLLFVSISIARLPMLFASPIFDEKIYLDFGRRMSEGAVLYRDIWDNKPPLIYYLHQLDYTLFGLDYTPVRILDLLSIFITIYFGYKLFVTVFDNYKFSKMLKGFLIAALSITVPFVFDRYIFFNSESIFIASSVAGIYYYFCYVKKKISWVRWIALLCFSIAITTKMVILLEIVLLIGLFQWYFNNRNLKQAFIDFAIILLPLLVYGIVAIFFGYFAEYISALGLFVLSYANDSIDKTVTNSVFDLLVFRIVLYITTSVAVFVLINNTRLKIILLWFCAALFAATLTWKSYSHYLQPLIIPTIFVACSTYLYVKEKIKLKPNMIQLYLKANILCSIVLIIAISPLVTTYSVLSYEYDYYKDSWDNGFASVKIRYEYPDEKRQEYSLLTRSKTDYYWLLIRNPVDAYFNSNLLLAQKYYMPVNSIHLPTNMLLKELSKYKKVTVILEKEFEIEVPSIVALSCIKNNETKSFVRYECVF